MDQAMTFVVYVLVAAVVGSGVASVLLLISAVMADHTYPKISIRADKLGRFVSASLLFFGLVILICVILLGVSTFLWNLLQ